MSLASTSCAALPRPRHCHQIMRLILMENSLRKRGSEATRQMKEERKEQESTWRATRPLIKMKPFIKTIILRLEIIFRKTYKSTQRQCKTHSTHNNGKRTTAATTANAISVAHRMPRERKERTENNSENYERIFLSVGGRRRGRR